MADHKNDKKSDVAEKDDDKRHTAAHTQRPGHPAGQAVPQGARATPPPNAAQQPAAQPMAPENREGMAGMAYPNALLDPAASPPSQLYPANPGAALTPPPFDVAQALENLRAQGNGSAFIDRVTDDLDRAISNGDTVGATAYLQAMRQNKAELANNLAKQ